MPVNWDNVRNGHTATAAHSHSLDWVSCYSDEVKATALLTCNDCILLLLHYESPLTSVTNVMIHPSSSSPCYPAPPLLSIDYLQTLPLLQCMMYQVCLATTVQPPAAHITRHFYIKLYRRNQHAQHYRPLLCIPISCVYHLL